MTDESVRQQAIALYDHFTHVDPDRRRFMADLTRLAGSAAAATSLLAGIAADPAAAAIVAEDDPRVTGTMVAWETAPGRTLKGYRAIPKGGTPTAAVMVVHENRGLQPYTRDVARRLAIAGFEALAPDFLTPSGGTPLGDDDKARGMISVLDLSKTVADGIATVKWLATKSRSHSSLPHGARTHSPPPPMKVGVVGFCWGGALADRIAVEAGAEGSTAPAAVCAFYGPAPDPADAVKVRAPLLLHYAGLDTRVDQSAEPWVAALKAAHKDVTAFTYPGVNHAFHNDTSTDRYNADAANLAWDRTIAFFRRTLS